MKSVEKRIDEFVHYHITGDGECNNVVLRAWADKHCLTYEGRLELAYFFALTYCVESAIIMYEDKESIARGPQEWSDKYKKRLIFQSDRKYIKMRNSFAECLMFYYGNNIKTAFKPAEVIDLKKYIPLVEKWHMFGRFAAFLFLETLAYLTDAEIKNASIDWKNGNTATSGLLNVFGFDNDANMFDRTRRLEHTYEEMDGMLETLLEAIYEAGGETNVTFVETSLCAYRKFYKASRYNGYYLDRMLEEILAMAPGWPEISKELVMIRIKSFNEKYLGEIHGWKGIRKDQKKLYIKAGLIM